MFAGDNDESSLFIVRFFSLCIFMLRIHAAILSMVQSIKVALYVWKHVKDSRTLCLEMKCIVMIVNSDASTATS